MRTKEQDQMIACIEQNGQPTTKPLPTSSAEAQDHGVSAAQLASSIPKQETYHSKHTMQLTKHSKTTKRSSDWRCGPRIFAPPLP